MAMSMVDMADMGSKVGMDMEDIIGIRCVFFLICKKKYKILSIIFGYF